jgi:hypothetical protein
MAGPWKCSVLKQNMSYVEIVRYKNRIGVSKVSGTVKVCNGWNKNNRLDFNIPSIKLCYKFPISFYLYTPYPYY